MAIPYTEVETEARKVKKVAKLVSGRSLKLQIHLLFSQLYSHHFRNFHSKHCNLYSVNILVHWANVIWIASILQNFIICVSKDCIYKGS